MTRPPKIEAFLLVNNVRESAGEREHFQRYWLSSNGFLLYSFKECYESVDHSAMPLHFKVFFLQNLQDCMGIGGFASGGSEDLGCRPFSRR